MCVSMTHAQIWCVRGGLVSQARPTSARLPSLAEVGLACETSGGLTSSVHSLRSSVKLSPRAWTVGDLPAASMQLVQV